MNRVLFATSISATAAVGVVAAAQLFQGLAPAAVAGRVEAASAGAAAVPSPPEADGESAGVRAAREADIEPAGPGGSQGERGAMAVEGVAAVEHTAAEDEGDGLIVVAPTLDTVASLSGGVPSLFQVGGSLVTARLGVLLPSEVAGPILDAYVDGVDVVTQGAQGVGQTAEALSAATVPLGTAFNEPANAVAGTGVSALVAGTDGAGEGAEVAGVHTNLFDYTGQTAQSTASAFGIDGPQSE